MCEITVENFNAKFKEIDKNLKNADFLGKLRALELLEKLLRIFGL